MANGTSPAIDALLKRMDSTPEEFLNPDWWLMGAHKTKASPFFNTRWEDVTLLILNNLPMYENVFSPEACSAYKAKLDKLIRAKVEESICKEVIGGEYKEEVDTSIYRGQLEMFPAATHYPPTSKI